ncbi:cytochrome c-type biogenesis protein CcmH [Deinococcus detaillensis]|uniref:Cytochrome c-type biogenesis protein n=1 Tax=Deinococcus detaillensis TaxID=2592048 RepID=A0A553UUX0_9DEIO|nr:cytochrome c-type biogenesis protein CcmH [Deinococcus detaillensis]TSA83821.1 cytochrome c-type biogenesis protein CcmH [Deinococcus detaillensis]
MSALKRLLTAFLLTSSALAAPLTPAQQSQVSRVGNSIRCPICRDVLPITESGNDISKQMLSEISAQTQAGQTDAQIYDYFRERYGQRVLLRPSNDFAGKLLWLLPSLALLLGGGALTGYLVGQRRGAGAPVKTAADPALNADEPEDPYLAEIRAQVQTGREQQRGES